ncbi:hypothetical protein MTO96_024599 [Rhipicephalus appendiculatus]
MCILLLLLGALLIRWATRGPRVVPRNGTKEATTKTPATTTVSAAADVPSPNNTEATPVETTEPVTTTETATTTEDITTTPDPAKPYAPTPGTEHYSGDLVGDVRPLQYDVTFALNGAGLEDAALSVTGRSVASLKVHKATSKVILKAGSTTIKGVKMALLEVPAAPAEGAKGLGISTLSVSDPFFIVELEEQLEEGKSYTLVVEYDYDTAVEDGPISVSAGLAKMQLKEGKAHAAYPCFEKTGWNVPVVLTLQTPKEHYAVANTPMDGQPTVVGNLNAHKFKATPTIMPLDMLAWTVFPTNLKLAEVLPGKVNIYAVTEKADRIASAKAAFDFLGKHFQTAENKPVTKIDLVFTQTSETQESLGFAVLEESAEPETVCRKMADQWTRILLRQPATPTWLGSAGVTYLCRLAVTEESQLPASFLGDLEGMQEGQSGPWHKGLTGVQDGTHFTGRHEDADSPTGNTWPAHVLKTTTTDEELAIFEPDVTKGHLTVWRKEGFKTKQLERTFGTTKMITWKNTDNTETPFATASDKSAIALRAPSAVAVAWLNKNKANFTISIGDTTPVYVNPSMMACYGIQMDFDSWTLVGKDMGKTRVDAINRWYLLGEAARQFKDAKWPNFVGYMWMWSALRPTDLDLWDEHVELFIQTASKAYPMITSSGDNDAYSARIEDIIEDNLKYAKNSKRKGAWACKLSVDDSLGHFDPEKLSAHGKASLTLRLAYAGCFEKGRADDKVNEVYDEALKATWNASAAAAVRTPYGLRERALKVLTNTTQGTASDFAAPKAYEAALATAAALHLIRTKAELTAVKAVAVRHQTAATRARQEQILQDIKDSLVSDNTLFQAWLRD